MVLLFVYLIIKSKIKTKKPTLEEQPYFYNSNNKKNINTQIDEFEDGSILISSDKSNGLLNNGKHYTEMLGSITTLKRHNKNQEVIDILKETIKAIEREKKLSKEKYYITAPYYYEQLAIMYRKEKQYQDEVNLIEHFIKHTKNEQETTRGEKIKQRLNKANELLTKSLAKNQPL